MSMESVQHFELHSHPRQERSFHDELSDWMQRAPWLALSAAAHVLLVVILLAIPWEDLRRENSIVCEVSLDTPPEAPFEDPPLEEPVELEPQDPSETPQLVDVLAPEDPVVPNPDSEPTLGDPDFLAESPFDHKAFENVIGIGGNAGGPFGNRFGDGRKPGKGGGGGGTEDAVKDGLAWLRAHQSPDGSWRANGYTAHCGKLGANTCSDVGDEANDIGATGLALLAFLGDGHTTMHGAHREVVARGVKWLVGQQDPDTGLFGGRIGHAFLYNHAIASLAVCEAYYFSKSPLLRGPAQRSIEFIMMARNPYGAWRYDAPGNGDNDTSVTGWMVLALKSASEAGLKVDRESFTGALTWIDEVTDPANGRVGYDTAGSPSSRVPRINDHFNARRGESMTAVGLLCRFFLGQTPDENPILRKHADLLAASLPKWDPDPAAEQGVDFYYWYYGSYAMYQMGGERHWSRWNKAMKSAVVESQRVDGDEKGSWDARVDPWGHAGGRVYSTALGVLCLEVYYRYARVLGAR